MYVHSRENTDSLTSSEVAKRFYLPEWLKPDGRCVWLTMGYNKSSATYFALKSSEVSSKRARQALVLTIVQRYIIVGAVQDDVRSF